MCLMVFLLVLAIALFLIGVFTAKILWWAALLLVVVWAVGRTRSGSRIGR
jgi:hypothetical protein